MTGAVDPWLAKYANVGGPAWAELGWVAPDYKPDEATTVAFTQPVAKPDMKWIGTGIGTMPGATALTDATGATVGWTRAWGKGKLIAYGILPDSYSTDPHVSPDLSTWIEQWRKAAALPTVGRWVSGDPQLRGTPSLGSEAVEVVVREKSPAEKFVFCLNQGGAGAGSVEVTVPAGTWTATDALTGKPVAGTLAGSVWTAPLSFPALGYRVLHLVRG
jgi:hypothetical protein